MANEFRKVTDQNGVDHPVTDDTRVTWTANGVLGAGNILVNQVSAGTVSDVAVSSVDNDKIKLVGTANNANNAIYSNQKVGAGSYRLSAVYTGTSSDNQRPSVIADLYNANGTVKTANYVVVRPSSTSANVTVTGTDYLSNFCVYFANGDVLDMEIAIDLKLASDTNTEHVKGAMTNRELTEIKEGTISEITNSYVSFNTSSAFLLSRAGVKQLYMFVTVNTVSGSDDWVHFATLSEKPHITFSGITVPWDSTLSSARSMVYMIDTDGKVYIRAKAAVSTIISLTFI